MADTVTIYRCNSWGTLDSEEGCTPSESGRIWIRLDNGKLVKRFLASCGWTTSKQQAAGRCFSYWSDRYATACRTADASRAMMDEFRVLMEQEVDNGFGQVPPVRRASRSSGHRRRNRPHR